MDLERTACNLNIIADYLAVRDIGSLTSDELYRRYGLFCADTAVLFGGSILQGGDEFASAIQNAVASKYIIVGGEGHTTDALRKRMNEECPQIETGGRSEAECFNAYISEKYGVKADYLETESSNCGSNITKLLDLFEREKIPHKSIIMIQDATMQRRMDATMRKYLDGEEIVINYASYRATVVSTLKELIYLRPVHGMWSIGRYISLLMGEIVRLRDDEDGYGPKGKGFIAHTDIPEEVEKAYSELLPVYGEGRTANPASLPE